MLILIKVEFVNVIKAILGKTIFVINVMIYFMGIKVVLPNMDVIFLKTQIVIHIEY